MNRRRVIVNGALALALVGVGVGAYASLADGSSPDAAEAQTVTVTRGNLTATVTASGNAETATSVGVELAGSGGTVTRVYVKAGDKVEKGARLVKIDDTSARETLRTAKASLASAKAQLTTATQGRSAQEAAQDDAAIAAARTAVDNAETALAQARATYGLDQKQQRTLVRLAEDAVDRALDQKRKDQADLAAAGDEVEREQLETAVATDSTAIITARAQLTQAKQTRDSTLLRDRQSISTQSGALETARDQLASQRAAAEVNAQPAKQGEIDAAQAQIDSAEVVVEQAEQELDDTVLRAPVDGTVSAVTAVEGQSSTASGSDSGTGTATGTDSTTDSSSTSTGLVTLSDLTQKQVVASVAEADVTKVEVGQTAEVTFSASGETVAGTVTAIDTESTVTDNVVEYGVTVTLDEDAASIRLGQTASLTITTGQAEDVLIVPTSAVTSVGGRSTVTRRVDGVDSAVEVGTGLVGTTGTEVTSGLAEGDTLVLPVTTDSSELTFPDQGGRIGVGGGPR